MSNDRYHFVGFDGEPLPAHNPGNFMLRCERGPDGLMSVCKGRVALANEFEARLRDDILGRSWMSDDALRAAMRELAAEFSVSLEERAFRDVLEFAHGAGHSGSYPSLFGWDRSDVL